MFKIRPREDYPMENKSNRIVKLLHDTEYKIRRKDKKSFNKESGEVTLSPVYDKISSIAEAGFHTVEDAHRAMNNANLNHNDYKVVVER